MAIIATGLCVNSALEAAEKLAADGIQAKVVNIHTIKPLDEELVVAAAKECGKVVTVEEHSVIGGLGSAVCDVLCEKAPTPVLKIGVQDVFGESCSKTSGKIQTGWPGCIRAGQSIYVIIQKINVQNFTVREHLRYNKTGNGEKVSSFPVL